MPVAATLVMERASVAAMNARGESIVDGGVDDEGRRDRTGGRRDGRRLAQ